MQTAFPHRIAPAYYVLSAVVLLLAGLGLGLLLTSAKHEAPSITAPVVEQQAPVASQDSSLPVLDDNASAINDAGRKSQSTKRGKQKAVAQPVAPAPVWGMISIGSSPEGAAIRIDGQPTSFVTPHDLPQLAPGTHTVTVARAGFDEATRTVQVFAGQSSPVRIVLNESRGTVAITSEPAGAEVTIDGNPTGRVTPVTVALLRGNHTFSLRKNGFVAATSAIDVLPGQNYRVAPRLAALGDAAQVKEVGKLKKLFGGNGGMSRLQFRSVPKGAQIFVNQRLLGKTTPAEFAFPPGTYEVQLTLSGYKAFHQTIQITEGLNSKVEATLEPSNP